MSCTTQILYISIIIVTCNPLSNKALHGLPFILTSVRVRVTCRSLTLALKAWISIELICDKSCISTGFTEALSLCLLVSFSSSFQTSFKKVDGDYFIFLSLNWSNIMSDFTALWMSCSTLARSNCEGSGPPFCTTFVSNLFSWRRNADRVLGYYLRQMSMLILTGLKPNVCFYSRKPLSQTIISWTYNTCALWQDRVKQASAVFLTTDCRTYRKTQTLRMLIHVRHLSLCWTF